VLREEDVTDPPTRARVRARKRHNGRKCCGKEINEPREGSAGLSHPSNRIPKTGNGTRVRGTYVRRRAGALGVFSQTGRSVISFDCYI